MSTAPLDSLRGRALRRWRATDPVMADLARRHPFNAPRPAPSAFAALVTSLVHQQVSVAAGRTITRRLVAACDGRLTPRHVAALGAEGLRQAGVSRQKQGYVLDLAARAENGGLRLSGLARLSDAEVVDALTGVKGIGPWTAKMFLLFHLRRPDVVASEDLGLRVAAQRAYNVAPARAVDFLEAQAARWSPYGSVASLTLWASLDASR